MLLFARAPGGNFLYINPANEAVYYWDHEDDSADLMLASSFSEFLAALERFDLNHIKLKPGQVLKAGITPGFTPEF